jgi:hypothetical protein
MLASLWRPLKLAAFPKQQKQNLTTEWSQQAVRESQGAQNGYRTWAFAFQTVL